LAVAFAAPGPALAKHKPGPPPNDSAVSQYIEVVPTADGGVASAVGEPQSKAVASRIRTLLTRKGGADAAKLREIVSSSAYGAPQKRFVQPHRAVPRSENVLSAAISASGSGASSRALWLFGILVMTTLAALVMAALRQRARRD